MLNIYRADALTDKERFIFDRIDPDRKTILIVPDQFSLQAERDALELTGRKSLMELTVTDFNRLGHAVIRETEGHEPRIIDKYGRHMLLCLLIERLDEDLTVFRGQKRGTAFVDQMNTMISELKRYEIGPEELSQTIDQLREGSGDPKRAAGNYLVLKLEDILRIYRSYEKAIEGIYQDSEDLITYYADRIPSSSLVQGAQVWIYGFDTFTPKNLLVIRRLLEAADQVNVVLTYEGQGMDAPDDHRLRCAAIRSLTRAGGAGLFRLTDQVMEQLENAAEEAGREHRRHWVPAAEYDRGSIWEHPGDHITLVRATGSYEEAEAAAAFIQSLVREEGYRYGDIAVLCNDMDGRGRSLHRALQRWDIPAFADTKRKVLHQPVVSFLLSFLEVLSTDLKGEGILGMVKSGMLGWPAEDEGLLENYLRGFRIRGSRWKKEFTRRGDSYTRDQLDRLNEMRESLVSICSRAKDAIGRRNTAGEKIAGLIGFLQDDFHIRERIEAALQRQKDMGLLEGAGETAQIWNAVCGIFDQIIQIIGRERVSNRTLRDVIAAGLESQELGLVPGSRDCVIIGTLQRTRPGRIRALVVTGANAGLLPLDISDEDLFSRREKERLEQMDMEFAGRHRIAQMEEQLAIYRMFSLPGQRLYVSCSQNGEDGSAARPSEVFRQLQKWQPRILEDLQARPLQDQLGSAGATMPYLADALRRAQKKEKTDPGWTRVLDWYREHEPLKAGRILRGIDFDNHREALGEDMADALYRGDRQRIEVSASRLEKFSGCPFAHFIQYGLRAQEDRQFEVGGREIGDVYHQCMMEFSRQMQTQGRWQTVTEEECRSRVGRILQEELGEYRDGLFTSDAYGRFRMERITEICGDIAWMIVGQVRQGTIRKMYFEEPFGNHAGRDRQTGESAQIPPVDITVGDKTVRIRGIIDRMDVLAGEGGQESVRIIDYKTGNNVIRTEDFEKGYKLQLMVYMDAAMKGTGLQPAGVFYFKIRDFSIDGDKDKLPDPEDPGDLQQRMRRFYRLEGIVVNDPDRIGAMDQAVAGGDKAESRVIPVAYDPKKESYVQKSGGTLLGGEEFQQLLEATNRQVENLCGQLIRGEIDAVPKRETKTDRDGKRISACGYCDYQSICMFDPAIKGCRYEDV